MAKRRTKRTTDAVVETDMAAGLDGGAVPGPDPALVPPAAPVPPPALSPIEAVCAHLGIDLADVKAFEDAGDTLDVVTRGGPMHRIPRTQVEP